jgi:tetratricopeptide (TPR) repeat protein
MSCWQFTLRFLVIAAVLIAPACAQRSSPNGMVFLEVDVQVRYQDGTPGPAGIHIILESAEGGFDTDCQTVEGGKCRLQPSATGVYIVSLNQNGYLEASQRVELVGILHAFATLTLRPARPADGTTPAADAPSAGISVADYGIPPKARQEYSKAEEALHAKDPDQAVKHLQKALKEYSNYPKAQRLLGESYLALQDWQKAEVALKKSIELDPKESTSYLDLGAVYNQQKAYPQAEEALKKCIELSPDAGVAKYELAKTYMAMGRWEDAEPYVKQTVRDAPDLAPAHVLMGNIYLKRRDAPSALHEYQEYLRLEPAGAMAPQVREMVDKLEKTQAK